MPCASFVGQLVLPSACAAEAGGQRWRRRRCRPGLGSLLVCYRPLAPPRYLLREFGASTSHDMAVARAAFGFAWPRNETLAYHAQPPRDPIFGPAHCDELSRRR